MDISDVNGKLVITRLLRSCKYLALSCITMKNDQTYFNTLLVCIF